MDERMIEVAKAQAHYCDLAYGDVILTHAEMLDLIEDCVLTGIIAYAGLSETARVRYPIAFSIN